MLFTPQQQQLRRTEQNRRVLTGAGRVGDVQNESAFMWVSDCACGLSVVVVVVVREECKVDLFCDGGLKLVIIRRAIFLD